MIKMPIKKTAALYLNKKKATYFELQKLKTLTANKLSDKFIVHLEFPNINDWRRYVVKINKEKFKEESFKYKIKQCDYIEEYKTMIQELGNITPEEKTELNKEYNNEIQRIKKGLYLTFVQRTSDSEDRRPVQTIGGFGKTKKLRRRRRSRRRRRGINGDDPA